MVKVNEYEDLDNARELGDLSNLRSSSSHYEMLILSTEREARRAPEALVEHRS